MTVIKAAGITDVGKKRKGNEDSYFIDDEMGIYVVADGMGGHKAGEVASKLVADTIRDYMKRFKDEKSVEELDDIDDSVSKEGNRLLASIKLANQVVYQLSSNKDAYKGMGSTVSAVYLTGSTVITANVGDSPIYLFRNDNIEEVYTPHTFMAEQAALAPKGAKRLSSKFSHMLTRGMGTKPKVKADLKEIPYFKNDIILICSDGLSDKVTPKEIKALLSKIKQPGKACKALVDLANSRGGDDNITIIILNFLKSSPADPLAPEPKTVIEIKEEVPEEETTEYGDKIFVEYDTDDGSYSTYVNGFTNEGVFLETTEAFTIGQEIMLSFSIPGDLDSFMLTGQVVKRSAKGIELNFQELSERQKEIIKSFSDR